jgi:hypothetical protein
MNKKLLFLLMALVESKVLYAQNLTLECPHKNISLTVEIARTPEEQTKGLMFRETLDDNAGMSFLYSKPAPIAMWMKNTPLSLDMIFADEKGAIVAIYEKATPYSLSIIGPVQGVSHVLEVKSGVVKKNGITKACLLKLVLETPPSPQQKTEIASSPLFSENPNSE